MTKRKNTDPFTNILSTPAPLDLRLPSRDRVTITLVGCGGTGSHIASGLAALVMALNERGISSDVLFIDPDIVEQKNVGRQLFSPADVGKFKAEVLAARLNATFNLKIGAATRPIDRRDTFRRAGAFNLVIGAVDNPAARAMIAAQVKAANGDLWWLDCGNDAHSGQVLLGNCWEAKQLRGAVGLGMVDRLPGPHLTYPDLLELPKKKVKRNDRTPSCAELTAAGEQGLMVNRMVAAWACTMLNDLLIGGQLRYFGLTFNLNWGGTQVYVIDLPTLTEVTGLSEQRLREARVQGER